LGSGDAPVQVIGVESAKEEDTEEANKNNFKKRKEPAARIIHLDCGSFVNPQHNRIRIATIATPVHGVVGMIVTLKILGKEVGRFKNPAIKPMRAIGHGRDLVPWLPETKLFTNRVMPFNPLLEGFRNVDRPADGLLSPKEFTIFSRIQGDNFTRSTQMQTKLKKIVNLDFIDDSEQAGQNNVVAARAFVEEALADVIGQRPNGTDKVEDAMIIHGTSCTLTVDHRTETPEHPLIFFRGEEFDVEWIGLPRQMGSTDVFRLLSVTPDTVCIEGTAKHGAFATGDQVEVVQDVSHGGAFALRHNMYEYACENLGLSEQVELGECYTVHSAGLGLSGSEVTLNAGSKQVVLHNPRARGTFKNPENADEVSCDFCEWSAVLARSMFTSDSRIRTRIFHSPASHVLFEKALVKFTQNVSVCLEKTLPANGCTLQEFLICLSTKPMGEVVHHAEGQMECINTVSDQFSDGASSLSVCIDLYAFLTCQDDYLQREESDDGVDKIDVGKIVQSTSWLRLI
jgi:hypothetical protein